MPRANTNGLKSEAGLGVTTLVYWAWMAAGTNGVGVMVGVLEMAGVRVMLGVMVIVGVSVMVGVRLIVGVRLGVSEGA